MRIHNSPETADTNRERIFYMLSIFKNLYNYTHFLSATGYLKKKKIQHQLQPSIDNQG